MVEVESEDLSLPKIARSGQCFRMTELEPGRFRLIAAERVLELEAREDGAILRCSQDEYQALWRTYFDLDTDYARFRSAIPQRDRYLTAAAEFGRGIRILRQEPWETLVTFLLSQRRNIPAIRRSVELLCRKAGEPLGGGCYSFPTPEGAAELTDAELASCSLGYRVPYVRAAALLAAAGGLDGLSLLSDAELEAELRSMPGVGPKVANCVMLFGFYRLSGFPRDVWINRVIDGQYGGRFSLRRYRGFEGVIQQYLFYYGRSGGK